MMATLRPRSASAKRPKTYATDSYGVVHLEGNEFTTKEQFEETIEWIRERRRASADQVTACWLRLIGTAHFSLLLESALSRGFIFHHANGTEAVLGLWLNDREISTLPKGSTHTIGVGAAVIDEMNGGRILVVKEKLGPAKGKWKVVTGLVDVGENIADAAAREVLEETGVETVCVSEIVALREMHNHVFGLSNIYFVCLLKAANGASLNLLTPCQKELEAAAWISLEEYAQMNYYPEGTLYDEIKKCTVQAARRLIGNATSDFGVSNQCISVDKFGMRKESLWAPRELR